MTETPDSTNTPLSLETSISASPDAVWRALTEEIGAWWPAEFYIGGEAGKRSFTLETRPGGRMVEEWEDGGGLLWGTVCTVMPGKMLQVVGHTFPDWGGPSTYFGTWKLSQDGNGTKLCFEEQTVGRSTAENTASKLDGWTYLFDKVLKAYVEGTPIPPWEG